jgi:hypothetical protein
VNFFVRTPAIFCQNASLADSLSIFDCLYMWDNYNHRLFGSHTNRRSHTYRQTFRSHTYWQTNRRQRMHRLSNVYMNEICNCRYFGWSGLSAHRQKDFESAEYKTETSLDCLTKVKQSREWFWFLRKGTIDSVGHFNQFPKPSLIVMTNICSQTTLSPCFVQHVHADPHLSPA